MEKLKRKEIIERLSRFRACGDRLSDDLYNLSMKVLNITSELEVKPVLTNEEREIFDKLSALTQPIMQATLNSNEYNKSMLKDYTSVIKSLSLDSEGRE